MEAAQAARSDANFLGFIFTYTYAAQHLITVGQDLDYLDRDLSVGRVNWFSKAEKGRAGLRD